jgi:hypothetical protein
MPRAHGDKELWSDKKVHSYHNYKMSGGKARYQSPASPIAWTFVGH